MKFSTKHLAVEYCKYWCSLVKAESSFTVNNFLNGQLNAKYYILDRLHNKHLPWAKPLSEFQK